MKPAGCDAPITPIDGCCADKCKAFLDGSYRRGCKDTVDRMLEIIDTAHFDLDDSALERDVYMRVSEYRKWMKKAVLALKGGEQE